MHHARCTCKSCSSVRNSLLIDELPNDGTSEEFASKILCDARELMEEDEDEEKVKTQTDEEEQKEERALVHTNTKKGNLITLREISALLTPIHRELNEIRSEVTKLKNDIVTLKNNKKEEKISHEETTETEHENKKFFPLSVPPITYETFKSSSFSTSSIECEERNGEISLLSEVDRMLSSVRQRYT